MVTLGAGGLVPLKTAAVTMQSEDLEISIHSIRVHYVFRNDTDHDVQAVIGFPLPDINGGEVNNEPMNLPSKDPNNFVDFAVMVEGNPVPATLETKAFSILDDGKPNKEITATLKQAGLPLSVLDPRMTQAIRSLPKTTLKEMEARGLIFDEDNPWPTWITRNTYYWHQTFPAHRSLDVIHTYKPVVGGSYIVADEKGRVDASARTSVGRYCGTPAAITRVSQIAALNPPSSGDTAFYERQVDYILSTANNWKGPIGHFHLAINTDGANDVLVSCFPGLKKLSSTRYEAHVSSFRPSKELSFEVLQTNTER